jgi:hypothetical protein
MITAAFEELPTACMSLLLAVSEAAGEWFESRIILLPYLIASCVSEAIVNGTRHTNSQKKKEHV